MAPSGSTPHEVEGEEGKETNSPGDDQCNSTASPWNYQRSLKHQRKRKPDAVHNSESKSCWYGTMTHPTKKRAKATNMHNVERCHDQEKVESRFVVKYKGRVCCRADQKIKAEREAARIAIGKMKKTAEWNNVPEVMQEFEKLIGMRSRV